MLCFFRRESAKFVPMVRVAGRAGGTTMVMRSRARTMMRCHASCCYRLSANAGGRLSQEMTYSQSDKIDEGGDEPQQCDHGHHADIAKGITVEFEPRGFWKEH